MYLHVGSNYIVRKSDVIGIFDIDSNLTPEITRDFLKKSERKKITHSAGDDLPKSFVLVKSNGREKIIFSHISSVSLAKRAGLPL